MAMIPATAAGVGLRAPHYAEMRMRKPALGFVEVHSENFFFAGGPSMRALERAREDYAVSLHGVGMSIASADSMSENHLGKLAALVERIEPALVSEHLCWGAVGGIHFNDLMPFPYTGEALEIVTERVDHVQVRLRRKIYVENLSAYVRFAASEMSEFEFLAELVMRTGCGLLLDINNLYVNSRNFGFDAAKELARLPAAAIGEYHLAGHSRTEYGLMDTHGSRVCAEVWDLYETALDKLGPAPTLVEWDTDIPALDVLLDEARIARSFLEAQHAYA